MKVVVEMAVGWMKVVGMTMGSVVVVMVMLAVGTWPACQMMVGVVPTEDWGVGGQLSVVVEIVVVVMVRVVVALVVGWERVEAGLTADSVTVVLAKVVG